MARIDNNIAYFVWDVITHSVTSYCLHEYIITYPWPNSDADDQFIEAQKSDNMDVNMHGAKSREIHQCHELVK